MKFKLSPEEQDQLRLMSREGKRPRELAEIFHISIESVERYKFRHLRILSRQVMVRRRQEDKVKSHTCYKCNQDLKTHPKCQVCEILIHTGTSRCGGERCGIGISLH
jgi:DNA-binding CsgD family transcriptional regulator